MMKNLLIVIFGVIGVLTASSMSRLYFPRMNSGIYIEFDTNSQIFKIGHYYSDAIMAQCSLKHLADSFYMINYSPEEHGFANARVMITEDTTLGGRTRFTIFAPKLSKNHTVVPMSQTYHQKYNLGKDQIADGCWTKLISPSQTFNDTIYGFSFIADVDGMRDNLNRQHAYRYQLPEHICLSEGNRSVVIEMPCLSDLMFSQFTIRNAIIIVSDSTIVWNNMIFDRSRFNTFNEFLRYNDPIKYDRIKKGQMEEWIDNSLKDIISNLKNQSPK